MSDNRTFDLVDIPLALSLEVAFSSHKTAWGYSTEGNKFVLYWTDHPDATPFPVPLGKEGVLPMIEAWLESAADYGKSPDLDGNSEKSHRVSCDTWGHVDSRWQAFARIEPAWAMYGK